MSWHKHKNTQKYQSDLCCINLTLNWEYYVNTQNLQCQHKYDDTECMQRNIIKLCYGAISTEHNILCTTQQQIRNSLRKWFDGNNSYCDDRGALYLTLHMGEFLLRILDLFTEAFKVKQLLPTHTVLTVGWIHE